MDGPLGDAKSTFCANNIMYQYEKIKESNKHVVKISQNLKFLYLYLISRFTAGGPSCNALILDFCQQQTVKLTCITV